MKIPQIVSPQEWAAAAMELLAEPAPSWPATLAAFERSPMAMDRALRALLALHRQ